MMGWDYCNNPVEMLTTSIIRRLLNLKSRMTAHHWMAIIQNSEVGWQTFADHILLLDVFFIIPHPPTYPLFLLDQNCLKTSKHSFLNSWFIFNTQIHRQLVGIWEAAVARLQFGSSGITTLKIQEMSVYPFTVGKDWEYVMPRSDPWIPQRLSKRYSVVWKSRLSSDENHPQNSRFFGLDSKEYQIMASRRKKKYIIGSGVRWLSDMNFWQRFCLSIQNFPPFQCT
jgi:hypothetical protein